MDTRAALETLKHPKFGDDEQIWAVHYLEDVEAARVAFGKCRHKKNCESCNGKGFFRVANAQDVCHFCGGSGTGDECHCFKGIDPEAVWEAKRK